MQCEAKPPYLQGFAAIPVISAVSVYASVTAYFPVFAKPCSYVPGMHNTGSSSTFVLPGFGISGKAGSGKTTFAKVLMERLRARGASPMRLEFSMALKLEVDRQYGLRKGQPGWREAVVKHGADRRAEFGDDYWVRQAAVLMDRARALGHTPIIDDLRLINEHEFLLGQEMLCVRIDAPEELRARRLRTLGLEPEAAYSQDVTECELDNASFALRILNGEDTSVEDMRAPASQLCRLALMPELLVTA